MLLKLVVYVALFVFVASKSVTEVNNNNNKYIIVLKDDTTIEDIFHVMDKIQMREEREAEEIELDFINTLIPMVFAIMSHATVNEIAELPTVKYIEADQPVHMYPLQEYNASEWLPPGLQEQTDRYNLGVINKLVDVCGDNTYDAPNSGTGVDVYIVDTGIQYDHEDFKDANGDSRAHSSFDVVYPSTGGEDCNGHGTHCAGIAGGVNSGVAKDVNLYSVRVLGCSGSGSTSGVLSGINHVAEKHNENKDKPGFVASILSMSLGGGHSQTENNIVNAAVGEGVIVVTASGNSGMDACDFSPGSAGDSINVGAHSEGTSACGNPIESFSNYGSCVDVIAPGTDIKSAKYDPNSTNGYIKYTGTSMACPHVAGAAALKMKNDKTKTPAEVKAFIIDESQDDVDRSSQAANIRAQCHALRLRVPPSFNQLIV